MKKLLALLLTCTALLGTMTACDDGHGNLGASIEDMAEEDMPYGSTMKEMMDTKIPVCFDKRFIEDDVMQKVSDFFYAVQTDDEKLFKSVSNQDYLNYVENKVGQKTADYLKGIKANEEAELGNSFEYSYLEVTDYKKKEEDTQIGEVIKLMDQVYADNGKGTFANTVKNAAALTITLNSDGSGKSYSNTNVKVYAFTCEDGIYIFS